MSRLMSVVWIVQFWVFLAMSIASVVRPSVVMYLLDECVTVPEPRVCCPEVDERGEAPEAGAGELRVPHGNGYQAVVGCPDGGPPRGIEDGCAAVPAAPCGAMACLPCTNAGSGRPECVLIESDVETGAISSLARLLAPFFLAIALFSLHTMMRTDERTRRNMAFIFAGLFTVIAALVYTDGLGDLFAQSVARTHVFQSRALISALVALLLFALYSAVRAEDGSRRAAAVLAGLGYGGLLVPYLLRAGAMDDPALLGVIHLGGITYPVLHALAAAAGLVLALDTIAGDLERTRARLFAVVLVFPMVLFLMDFLNKANGTNALADEPTVVRVMLLLTVVDIVLHAQYAAWPIEDAEQKLSGSANTRPASLWLLWLLQGLAFVGFAALLLWAHRDDPARRSLFVADAVMSRLRATGWYTDMFGDLDELYPGLLVAMGLFSFSGMHSSREWVWKTHCFIFAVFYAAQMFCVMFVWNGAVFKPALMLLLAPSAVLCAVHVYFYRSHRRWFSEDVGEGAEGWVFADLGLGPLLLVKSGMSRKRASHAHGVAATGRMTVTISDRAPKHEFFQPGAVMDVHVRFGNERATDDAAVDARGAAVCLVAEDGARFDLTLSTGAFGAARNIVEFGILQVVSAMGSPGRRLLSRVRHFLEGGLAALRRAPASYASLGYHSQSVRFWVSSDRNERWLVRYRLVPADEAVEESGLGITIRDYVKRERAADERRPTDYLRRELKMRLQGKRTIALRLLGQFHNVGTGDGPAWYDPTSDWHAGEYPWLALGDITLQTVLSDEACEKLTFNTDNAPSSLGIPVSQSVFDPRSIADSERRVMRRVQELRMWLVAVLGLPRTPQRPVK